MSHSDVISFSFCQVSDLNLDSSAALSLHLSPAQRKQRSEESIEALAAAMKVAIRNDVNAVLIPGNLFDADNVTTSTLASVQKIFSRLQEIPVFIAPGAYDPLYSDSLYDESVLRARGLAPWSENVHIFGPNTVHSFTLPDKTSIRIDGIGLTKDNRRQTPYFSELEVKDKVAINILLLPLGFTDTGERSAKQLKELEKRVQTRGYSYVALSGFKNQIIFKTDEERIFAGAAGSLVGLTEKELGERTAIFGNLDRRIAGGIDLTMHAEEFDRRRIININFDISPFPVDDYNAELEKAIKKGGARKGTDILLLNLEGFYPVGAEVLTVTEQMKEEYFHLRTIDRTRPNYLETLSHRNIIESKFAGILGNLRNEVESEKERDPEKLAVIADALYFGLEAIREGKVSIRDAN